jgi:hypothetical protein
MPKAMNRIALRVNRWVSLIGFSPFHLEGYSITSDSAIVVGRKKRAFFKEVPFL